MKEIHLWDWLRQGWRPYRNLLRGTGKLHYQRVESHVAAGVPDIEACFDGVCFWMELKAVRPPKMKGIVRVPHLTPEQRKWMEIRVACGGRAWLMLQVSLAQYARRYLIKGDRLDEVGFCTERELELISVLPPSCSAIDILFAACGREPEH